MVLSIFSRCMAHTAKLHDRDVRVMLTGRINVRQIHRVEIWRKLFAKFISRKILLK